MFIFILYGIVTETVQDAAMVFVQLAPVSRTRIAIRSPVAKNKIGIHVRWAAIEVPDATQLVPPSVPFLLTLKVIPHVASVGWLQTIRCYLPVRGN